MAEPYWFDDRAADAACRFVETYCRHTLGEWSGRPFELLAWERHAVREAFGWKRPDGTRRYRTVWIELPRKNGKSEFAAAIALLMLFGDGEPGAEVYGVAVDKDQAGIVFKRAQAMVGMEPRLASAAEVFKTSIYVPEINGAYRPLSSAAQTKHGLSPSGVVGDEVHEWNDAELYHVLHTGTGSRRQPLEVYITTAGVYGQGVGWTLHHYAVQVRDGIIADDSWLVIIYAAEVDDDWTDPAVWRKANPGFGITVKEEYIRAECEAAQASPARQNAFRRLHLNQWTEQLTRWLDLAVWDRGAEPFDAELLRGRRCYAGLDLARVHDLSALALLFPPDETPWRQWTVLMRFWVPEADVHERVRRDRVPYDVWTRDGVIETTPGNTTDFDFLEAAILAEAEQYDIQEVAFDRMFAGELVQHLQSEGLTMVPFGQGFLSMGAPTAELERQVLGGQLRHGGNPVLRWNAANVVARQDPAGNLKPDKERSGERIDGIVALIMAIGRAVVREKPRKSIYADRGVLAF